MDLTFWLGLALGGLIGVLFDLWKRPLDRLLDRRLQKRTETRSEALALKAAKSKAALRNYLVEVVLQTTLIGSLVGILAGVVWALSGSISYLDTNYESVRVPLAILSTAGQLISIAGAGYIVRMAGDALALARRLDPDAEA